MLELLAQQHVWTNVLMKKIRQGHMFRINVKEKILIFEMNRIRWVITRLRGLLHLSPLPAKLVLSSVFTHCTCPSTWTKSCLKITKKINHFLSTIDFTKWRDMAQTQIKGLSILVSCLEKNRKTNIWNGYFSSNLICRRDSISVDAEALKKTGIGRRNTQPFDKNSS